MRLGVSRRTVRRDIDRLRGLGYPVAGTEGSAGGYRLAAGAAMPPLLLDDEEAVAVAIGLRTAASTATSGIEDATMRALAKLEHVLPARLRRRVRAIAGATVSVDPWRPAPVDPEVLSVLAMACSDGERLRFRYRGADGAGSRRLIEPHRMIAMSRRWYLLGYDVDKAAWRTFRADRIEDLRPTAHRAPPRVPPGGDAVAYVTAWAKSRAPVHQAVITLHAPAAALTARLGKDALEPLTADRCRWRTHADTIEWLASRLLTLGCDFHVEEPVELVDHLRVLAGRIQRGGCAENV